MRPFTVHLLWACLFLFSGNRAAGQEAMEELVRVERTGGHGMTPAEAERFREMLAKYRDMPADEHAVRELPEEDHSVLFEVHIDIPEIGEVRATAMLFAPNAHDVHPRYLPWLDHYAATLLRYPKALVRIEAHTDSTGNETGNRALSERRAAEVKAALVQRGVPPERIRAMGLGGRHPLGPNEDKEGRRMNRRVEIRTYFPIDRH